MKLLNQSIIYSRRAVFECCFIAPSKDEIFYKIQHLSSTKRHPFSPSQSCINQNQRNSTKFSKLYGNPISTCFCSFQPVTHHQAAVLYMYIANTLHYFERKAKFGVWLEKPKSKPRV